MSKKFHRDVWVGLVLLQMAVVGCLEVHAEMVRREVTYEAIEGKQICRLRSMFPFWQEMRRSWWHAGLWSRWRRMLTGRMTFRFH